MTEQEKQALRKSCAIDIESRPTSIFADYCFDILGVLDALDERDQKVNDIRKQATKKQSELCEMYREVERLKDALAGTRNARDHFEQQYNNYYVENQRLRKALEEILKLNRYSSDTRKIARKALEESK